MSKVSNPDSENFDFIEILTYKKSFFKILNKQKKLIYAKMVKVLW
jgi:hypothetical protein